MAVVELDAAGFAEALRGPAPALICFSAPWCPACRHQRPALDRAAEGLGPRALVGALDADRHRALAREYRVRGVPQLVVFRGGKEAHRFAAGARPLALILSVLDDVLGPYVSEFDPGEGT